MKNTPTPPLPTGIAITSQPMKVHCAQCGEELMGAVNRCWKCGNEFASQLDEGGLPPVRRSPVIPTAAIAVSETAVAAPPGESATAGASPFTPEHTAVLDAQMSAKPAAPQPLHTPRKPSYSTSAAAATGGAYASFVLGLISVGAAFYTIGALATAGVGLCMGVWGLHSQRRGLAMIGILLCCLALAIAGFRAMVDLYTYAYGVSPFAPDVPYYDEFSDPASTELIQ